MHPPETHHDARIFVIDDEPTNVLLLRRILGHEGYRHVHTTTNPMALPQMLEFGCPDLVLLDLNMPAMDGFEVIDLLEDLNEHGTYLPILVLTADANTATRDRALAGGAMDFVTKPFDRTEVLLRMHNLLQTRWLHARLEDHNRTLESRVRDRTAELWRAQAETVDRLALAAEFRDDHTGKHIRRVGDTSRAIALELGIDDDRAELIGLAAPLHDLGKIKVPDRVLLKPGPLDEDEFAIIRTHTEVGHELLRDSESPLLQLASVMALHHHDRWDGHGYHDLRGEDIPLEARIVSVADVYDALTHERCHKAAWPEDIARKEITDASGQQFDPIVVEAFLEVIDRPVTTA